MLSFLRTYRAKASTKSMCFNKHLVIFVFCCEVFSSIVSGKAIAARF
jgi:hypothetical protein